MKKKPYSPYNRFPDAVLKKILYITGATTLAITVIFNILDRSLVTPELDVPDGMIAFELTNNLHTARLMIDSWGTYGKLTAAFSLGLDYLYLVVYSLFLGIAAYMTGKKLSNRSFLFSKTGYHLSWMILLAALFDSIENFALYRILIGCQHKIWASTAFYFATIKFTIVLVTLLYLLIGLIMITLSNRSKNQLA